MLPDSPVVRRILAIAAVVLVVAALATVVVVSGGGDDELTASASSSTSAPGGGDSTGDDRTPTSEGSEPSAPAPTDAPPGTVGGTSDGGTTDTTVPPTETADGAEEPGAQDPGPVTPAQAGTYLYSFSRAGGEGPESGERRVVVEDGGEASGERRQSIRVEEGEGSFTHDVAWRADGVYVRLTTFNFGGQVGECDWEPDFRNMASPLSAGATWSYATSCTVMFGTTPVKVDRKGSFTVVESTRIQVAGEAVDVWKIQSVEDTVFGAFGASKEETTAYFSPKHGLRVKASTTASGSGPDGEPETRTEESEIKNLSPQ